jgi:hypothetical protein
MNKKKQRNIILEKLLKDTASEYFINNYEKLALDLSTFEELFDSRYTYKSNISRISKGKKIFKLGLNKLALENIIQSKRLEKDLKTKAKELLLIENSKNQKLKKLNFQNNEFTDFYEFTNLELIKLYSDIIQELKSREVIRSAKVTGDIGEYFAEDFYKRKYSNLEFRLVSNQNNIGYDAIDNKEKKYQIKTTTTNDTGDFKNIIDFDNKNFDILLVCQLDKTFNLESIYKLSWEQFWEVKIPRNNPGIYKVTINKKFIENSEVIYGVKQY